MNRSVVKRRNAGGFSLIEVLIALVVLAFGLLGLALLQTMNLRYTQSANQRTQAVNLGSELLDMMRSNRSEMASYAMTPGSFSGLTVGPDGCAGVTNMGAANNVTKWQCEVREALGPDADATVAIDAATSVVTVTVRWDESTIPGSTDGSIQMATQL